MKYVCGRVADTTYGVPMRTAGAFPGAGKERVPAQKGLTLPAEILTPQEVLAILHECRDTTTGIRDRALITVMYRSGLRVSEALSLEPKDVDLDIGTIAVLHGKGDRRRTVGIEKRVHPHGLRHTMAYELLMEGVPIPIIQRQLGHTSLQMTDTYLSHIAPKQALEVMSGRNWAAPIG
jgi:site-specific recombinase XerD